MIIATVGPKNVYGISNNPYKDSSGNPTNGATTGCHLHLSIKYKGKNVVTIAPDGIDKYMSMDIF